jgi:8-hydroxy-5-deazaflavin:NADPH oxidoreductase
VSTPSGAIRTLGILGAGRLGATLGRKAIEAGYRVLIATSEPPAAIALTVKILSPGSEPVSAPDAIAAADAVVLAVPFMKRAALPLELFGGKLVIDAMNYWPASDGLDPEVEDSSLGTSELVRLSLPSDARVVKALNTVGYHELDLDARPHGDASRKAIALAGDDRQAVRAVSRLIDDLGFDPVDAGDLVNGWALEPGGGIFGNGFTARQIEDSLRATVREPGRGRAAERTPA